MLLLMPFEEPMLCARVFDDVLLRQETRASVVFLKALRGEAPGWNLHSTTKMWNGYGDGLAVFGLYLAYEMQARSLGGVEEARHIKEMFPGADDWHPEMPPWVGALEVHGSHRAFLVAYDADYYGPKFPGIQASVELAWPEMTWPE